MFRLTTLAAMLLTTSIALGQFGPGNLVSNELQLTEGNHRLISRDLDLDNDTDIILRYGTAIVLFQNLDGAGGFGAADTIHEVEVIHGFDFADLDGDSDLDLVVAQGLQPQVVWFENQGNGTFGGLHLIEDGAGWSDIGALLCHDITNDGLEDVLVTADGNYVHWYVNDGGSLSVTDSAQHLGGPPSHVLLCGDMDLDGDQDQVTINWNGFVVVAVNDDGVGGAWTVASPVTGFVQGSDYGTTPQLLDVDADGDMDLVDAQTNVRWARNRLMEDGAWGAFDAINVEADLFNYGIGWAGALGCGDKMSILWQTWPWVQPVQWNLYNDQLGGFAPSVASIDTVRSVHLSAADLNSDGANDLIIADRDSSLIWWYPNLLPPQEPTGGIALTPFDTLCVSGDPYALDHAEPAGGTWSGEGVAGNIFTPPGSGSFEFSYQVVDPVSSCPLTTTQAITALLEPTITAVSGNFDDCDTAPLQLAGWPSGGSWSGSSDESGYVDKSCAVRPLSGEVYYNMEAVNGGFCQASTITFVLPACTPVDLGSDINACEEDEQDIVVELFMPSSSYFVELQGPFYDIVQPVNNLAQGFFNPAVGPGSFMIIGNVMNPFTCPGSDTLFIIVNPNPDPGLITTNLTFCANQSEGVVEMNMAGDFSAPINAASTAIGTFNPGLLGLGYHPFSFNVVEANGCAGFLIDSLLIVDPPFVMLDMSPININGGIVILEGGWPEGGTYTVNGELATTLDPGNYQLNDIIEVLYTFTDPLTGCSASATALVDIVTALGGNDGDSGALVFPNPTTDDCQVWFGRGFARISLLDALGREARHWSSIAAPARLNLSGLPAGSYILLIEASNRANRIRLRIQ